MIRRACFALVLILFSAGAARAQTATPTDTPTPTATLTPSATPELGLYVTVIAPGGTPEEAHDGALIFEITAGQVMQALLGIGLLIIGIVDLIVNWGRADD